MVKVRLQGNDFFVRAEFGKAKVMAMAENEEIEVIRAVDDGNWDKRSGMRFDLLLYVELRNHTWRTKFLDEELFVREWLVFEI